MRMWLHSRMRTCAYTIYTVSVVSKGSRLLSAYTYVKRCSSLSATKLNCRPKTLILNARLEAIKLPVRLHSCEEVHPPCSSPRTSSSLSYCLPGALSRFDEMFLIPYLFLSFPLYRRDVERERRGKKKEKREGEKEGRRGKE